MQYSLVYSVMSGKVCLEPLGLSTNRCPLSRIRVHVGRRLVWSATGSRARDIAGKHLLALCDSAVFPLIAIPFIGTCIAQLEERGPMSCLDALLEDSDDELFGPDDLEPSLAESQVCAHVVSISSSTSELMVGCAPIKGRG